MLVAGRRLSAGALVEVDVDVRARLAQDVAHGREDGSHRETSGSIGEGREGLGREAPIDSEADSGRLCDKFVTAVERGSTGGRDSEPGAAAAPPAVALGFRGCELAPADRRGRARHGGSYARVCGAATDAA